MYKLYYVAQPSKTLSSQVDALDVRTHLTAFYDLCRDDEWARQLTYVNVYSFYVWSQKEKKWTSRKQKAIKTLMDVPLADDYEDTSQVCKLARLQTVPATDVERFVTLMCIVVHILFIDSGYAYICST